MILIVLTVIQSSSSCIVITLSGVSLVPALSAHDSEVSSCTSPALTEL